MVGRSSIHSSFFDVALTWNVEAGRAIKGAEKERRGRIVGMRRFFSL